MRSIAIAVENLITNRPGGAVRRLLADSCRIYSESSTYVNMSGKQSQIIGGKNQIPSSAAATRQILTVNGKMHLNSSNIDMAKKKSIEQ